LVRSGMTEKWLCSGTQVFMGGRKRKKTPRVRENDRMGWDGPPLNVEAAPKRFRENTLGIGWEKRSATPHQHCERARDYHDAGGGGCPDSDFLEQSGPSGGGHLTLNGVKRMEKRGHLRHVKKRGTQEPWERADTPEGVLKKGIGQPRDCRKNGNGPDQKDLFTKHNFPRGTPLNRRWWC